MREIYHACASTVHKTMRHTEFVKEYYSLSALKSVSGVALGDATPRLSCSLLFQTASPRNPFALHVTAVFTWKQVSPVCDFVTSTTLPFLSKPPLIVGTRTERFSFTSDTYKSSVFTCFAHVSSPVSMATGSALPQVISSTERVLLLTSTWGASFLARGWSEYFFGIPGRARSWPRKAFDVIEGCWSLAAMTRRKKHNGLSNGFYSFYMVTTIACAHPSSPAILSSGMSSGCTQTKPSTITL